MASFWKSTSIKKDPELDIRKKLILETQRTVRKDRAYLISVIAEVIKKHWDVLEDKLESHSEEDDYANRVINHRFSKDMLYFSERVVIPELMRRIDENMTTNKNMTLIFANIVHLFNIIPDDLFGIEYEDSNIIIADKLLKNIDDSNLLPYITNDVLNNRDIINDPTFNAICSDNSFIANHSDGRSSLSVNFNSLPNAIEEALMEQSQITLRFGKSIQITKPVTVSSFVGMIMVLFLAMHKHKRQPIPTRKTQLFVNFEGNNPYNYEKYITKTLRNHGFHAKTTRGSGDFGVDVLASRYGKSFAIQCKLYNHTVGTKAVQEIVSGRIYYGADFAIVVSDNSFTKAAKSLARKSKVTLTHHKNLLDKIESLETNENETYTHTESENTPQDQVTTKLTTAKDWSRDDVDEIVTVILPTIRND